MKLANLKLNQRSVVTLVVVGVLVWAIFKCADTKVSMFENQGDVTVEYVKAAGADELAPANLEGVNIDLNAGCAMNSGVGLASALLPREMASQEDFGEFAPEDILKGQNFLDPRNQIGIPETVGGNLRNANQQIRADPPNPKQSYQWNNSTIVPDLMRRKL